MPIPDRVDGCLDGSAFCATLPQQLGPAREKLLLDEFLLRSNVPSYFRNFVDVEVQVGQRNLRIKASPDYLMLGSDVDNVRIPLSPISAQKIADAWDCVLPTKKAVDLIWRAAAQKLTPSPLPPTSQMTTVAWFVRSNDLIEKQLNAIPNYARGQLVAGHKKDVVVTSKIFRTPDKVAIYGWHQKNGRPIQGPRPNASSHDQNYADYSHGIRLIERTCFLDGSQTTIQDVLSDPTLCVFLSDEGVITEPRYKT